MSSQRDTDKASRRPALQPERRWISRHHPGVPDALMLQLAALAALPQPVPGVCMDCDGVAMVREHEGGYQVLSFHRDTCPSLEARAVRGAGA